LLLALSLLLPSSAPAVPVPTNAAPMWHTPTAVPLPDIPPSITAGDISLVHSPGALGGFVIRVAGKRMAIGQNHPSLAYVINGELRWLDLAAETPGRKLEVKRERDSLTVYFEWEDADGGKWIVNERFTTAQPPFPGFGRVRVGSAIDFRIGFTVDRARDVAYLPLLQLFPGANSFGTNKHQALLSGLEYLENEPSSSEADVIGPAARRQVPDNLKLTLPLMAIEEDGRFLALSWQPQTNCCALFDSPDRLFGSGGHVMGILFPGSDGRNRREGDLLPKVTERMQPGQPVVLFGTIAGGRGDSVVPALKQYVATHTLPSLDTTVRAEASKSYFTTAAGGWLDSKIRETNRFHHAIAGGSFPLQPAADAAVWMDLLADRVTQPELASRLRDTARDALAAVRPADYYGSGIGHVRLPIAPLLYGHVEEAVAHARELGRSLLGRFDTNLAVKYHPVAGKPDYAKTHYSDEANGLTSRVVVDLLEAAAFCGDADLLDAGLKRLAAMDKFRNGVPRGAQTWECPPHTPDILASAQMVRAYTLGYQLTGRTNWLEQARYWAWTGVPFVYLVNPADKPAGPYATIAVFGATSWQAPVWLGLPVQWCGLVYADALYRLAPFDPAGPWKKLADGITASGIQQTWPTSDGGLQGLLPDSFVLRAQHRNGPAINPATLEACALRFVGPPPNFHCTTQAYAFRTSRQSGIRVHAPGEIFPFRERGNLVFFIVSPVTERPYYVLLNGFKRKPQLKLNGNRVEIASPHQFIEKDGVLILNLQDMSTIDLEL
jgi:hypothetical protein